MESELKMGNVGQWRLYCDFVCGLKVRSSLEDVQSIRPKNRLHSAGDFYSIILNYLRDTALVSHVVEILGGVNPSMLDFLFFQSGALLGL